MANSIRASTIKCCCWLIELCLIIMFFKEKQRILVGWKKKHATVISCGLIRAMSASRLWCLWSMVRRFLWNRQWKIRSFEWWKWKMLLNGTVRPREFRDIHHSERDIGVLWIPQHRQKLTNTTSMQVKSTKHRHRSTLFNQWFNVYTCYLYLSNFPQNKHITTLPVARTTCRYCWCPKGRKQLRIGSWSTTSHC